MANGNLNEKVSVNINSSTLSEIDLLVDNGYYSNRSDFINQAVRELLREERSVIDGIIERNAHPRNGETGWFIGVSGLTAKEVEAPVMRLAQKARAVGIHLIVATQRPDVKVITGGIKANFPARIAFRVIQMIDSRTILDRPGAEQLIGRGDMLFSLNGDVTRVQCALVETDEVERIVEHISKQQGYTSAYTLPDYIPEGSEGAMGSEESDMAPKKYDSLFAEIARDAVTTGQISTSYIQRNYEVGFNRAGRITRQLEQAGIIGAAFLDKLYK